MQRLGASFLGALVVVLAMFWPAFNFFSTTDETPEFARITDYRAAFDVDADGTMRAHETLTVDLPLGRHGIFRFFDIADANSPHVRYVPNEHRGDPRRRIRAGSRSCTRARAGIVVARIGEADTTISGTHVYDITYRVDGVLTDSGSDSQFYWNLIPSGWRMPIARSTLTVTLPGTPGDDEVRSRRQQHRRVQRHRRRPHGDREDRTLGPEHAGHHPDAGRRAVAEPAHAAVDVAGSTRSSVARCRPRSCSPCWRCWPPSPGSCSAGACGSRSRRTRSCTRRRTEWARPRAPTCSPRRVDDEMYAATLLQMGDRGHGDDRAHRPAGWSLQAEQRRRPAGRRRDRLRPPTRSRRAAGPAVRRRPRRGRGRARQMQVARKSFDSDVKAWARHNGLLEFKAMPVLGSVGVIGGLLVAAANFFWNPLVDVADRAAVSGCSPCSRCRLLAPGASTIRTPKGREAVVAARWVPAGCCRRRRARTRFDFTRPQGALHRLHPVGGRVRLRATSGPRSTGSRRRRSRRCRATTSVGYPGMHGGAGSMADFANDFNTTMHSAISSYQATQTSSSGGGGGGFSGGGGGGGGGGGSW